MSSSISSGLWEVCFLKVGKSVFEDRWLLSSNVSSGIHGILFQCDSLSQGWYDFKPFLTSFPILKIAASTVLMRAFLLAQKIAAFTWFLLRIPVCFLLVACLREGRVVSPGSRKYTLKSFSTGFQSKTKWEYV